MTMDPMIVVGIASAVGASLAMAIGSIGSALGEGRALAQAMDSIAQQPNETPALTRTLFVGLAMVESTAIYCFVVAMIIIFANPFWDFFAIASHQTTSDLPQLAAVSLIGTGLCIGIGANGSALGEGRALAQCLYAIARQPDEANSLIRILFVGMAMVESMAIFCFVISMVLIFANPFWDQLATVAGK